MKIIKVFEEYDVDVVTFMIDGPSGKLYRKYRNEVFFHSLPTLLSIGAVDVAFKSNIVDKLGVKFDRRFGPGSIFPVGEDTLFLVDMFRAGAKIMFYPMRIGKHLGFSSTGNSLERDVIIARGAVLTKIFGERLSVPAIFLHSLRKYWYYNLKYSITEYISLLLEGRRKFIEINRSCVLE